MMVTDDFRSHGAAHHQAMPGVEHRTSKYPNNRAENSHQPTRQRERAIKRLSSPGHAQRLLFSFSGISPHFRPRRHRLAAAQYRAEMNQRLTGQRPATGATAAA
ncbi:hypothetical protein ACIF8T_34845 [Streptomyces sp. NPDC085946]|uniref:hypothetical protein n=1 Tax=Streptomyces sp. NPDC085946 TaxID=3365744 RepID=UPI0037D3AD9E